MANSAHARLDSIQLLRAIAALVVVWHHAAPELQHFHVLEQSTFIPVKLLNLAFDMRPAASGNQMSNSLH